MSRIVQHSPSAVRNPTFPVATWILLLPLCAGLWILLAASPLAAAEPPGGQAGALSVRDFGARGDGQADDTEAIQRAADRGGEICFPSGRYRITRPVVIDLDRTGCTSIVAHGPASLRMAGPGPALKFVGTHAGTANPDSVNDNVWQRQRTPMVDGLEIVGEHPEAIGLWLEGTFQPVITRVTVRNALHGIYLTRRARNLIVSNCHLYHNLGAGLLLEKLSLHQVNVDNCHISYNAGGGIVVRSSEIRNLQIGTCDIEANMKAGEPPAANILLDTTDGSIREGAIVGCTLQHSPEPAGGANIRFVGRSAQEPHKVGFFSIAANQISDTGVNIHLVHARGVSITGNTFFLGHQYNLLAEDCQLVLGANLFDRNPDYPPGSRDGLLLVDCRDSTLTGLQLALAEQPEGALVLRRCQRVNITGCTILDSMGCGILLDDAVGVRVSDCMVSDNRQAEQPPVALRLTGGRGNMVVNNLLAGQVEISPGTGLAQGNYDGRCE